MRDFNTPFPKKHYLCTLMKQKIHISLCLILLLFLAASCNQSNVAQTEEVSGNLQHLLEGKTGSDILLLDINELPLTDSEKISLLIQQGTIAMLSRQFTIAEERFQQALQFAENQPNKTKANVLRHIAVLQRVQGDMRAALHYYRLAYSTLDEDTHVALAGSIYQGQGILFALLGEMDLAIYYTQKSIDAAVAVDNRAAKATGWASLSIAYYNFGEYLLAEMAKRRAIAVLEEVNKVLEEVSNFHNLWSMYVNLAEVLSRQDRLEEAMYYAEKAAEITNSFGIGIPGVTQHSIYNRRGELYLERGDYANSVIMFNNALMLRRKMPEQLLRASTKNAMSIAYARQGDYNRAYALATEALEIAKHENSSFIQTDIYRNLASIYAVRGDIQQFWAMSDRSVALRDSIYTMQRITAIQELQIRYETEIKSMQLAQQAEEIAHARRNNLLLSFILVLVGILFIIAFFIHRYKMQEIRIRVRHYEDILRLKKEVQQQDKGDTFNKMFEKFVPEIERLFNEEKIYKRQGLTIDNVAKMLDTNQRYLSGIINERYQTKFPEFVKTYRIDEAIEMLKEMHRGGKFANYTLQAIAEEVGFIGKNSFSTAFKEITGVTPTEYLQALKEK